MELKQEKRVSKPEPPPEKQQLVAGVFAGRAAADAALKKIEGLGPQLRMTNASNILVLAKDDTGKVDVSSIDIGSSSGVNIVVLAERVAANRQASREHLRALW